MSISYHISLIRDKERELKDLEKRKDQLEDILRDINSDFDDNISDIHSQENKIRNSIENGISIDHRDMYVDENHVDREGIFGRADLNASVSCIHTEINDIIRRMDDLKREIRELEERIEYERREQERQREEAMKRLLGVE